MNSKKIKILGDIVVVAILFCVFGFLFFYGFFEDSTGAIRLEGKYFALLTVLGTGIIFAVGAVSAYGARRRTNALTPFFISVFCAQIAAFVGLCAVSFSLAFGIFADGVHSWLLRLLYVVFALVMIVGYAESVFISEPLTTRLAPEQDDDEDYDEDEDHEDDEEEN